jgi:prepilin-type N-terminal cleavage/methylation domain-containing protein
MTLRSRRGFTLVEIMIVVAIIGILIAIAVPGFIRAREASRTRKIQADLKRIDDANQEYAIQYNLDAGDAYPAVADLVSLGYLRKEPTPPTQGNYVQAVRVLAPDEAGDPDGYPSFDGLNPDGTRVHPDLLP